MIANYHTHTARCKHATGTDEEYVVAAIEAGIKTLGFSDHAPFNFPSGFDSYYKMTREQLPDYIASLRELREKYRGKIDIKIGLETEYYPDVFDGSLEFWHSCGIEYLIIGQHFIGEEYGDDTHRIGSPSTREHLKLYVDTLIAATKTGKISYIAHPDMINYTDSDEELYDSETRRLIEAAISFGVPLEFNLLGFFEERRYPSEGFWKIAAEYKPRVVIGADAHTPESFFRKETYERALAILESYGLTPEREIELKPLS